MFIKNLENIQGDERDIIIISTTYGKKKGGKFSQNYGPINQARGRKLLNVIITRAKKKLIVYTSIPEDRYQNYQQYLIDDGNNGKGIFYAYLSYAKAVSDRNENSRQQILKDLLAQSNLSTSYLQKKNIISGSSFEEEIYHMLLQYYPAKKIKFQHEIAGFTIDIAYLSKNKDAKSIAVECDGTKNHMSEEAYLYDLQKKKILEENGFVFYRVWSTKWWRDYKSELKSLVDFINDNIGISNKKSPPSNAIILDLTEAEFVKDKIEKVKIGDTVQF